MMHISKIKILSLTLAISSGLSLAVFAEDTNKPAAADAPIAVSPPTAASTNAAKAARPKTAKQEDVASTNATFGTVAVTDPAYKSAVDAHALEDALKLVDSEGGFKGKVAKIYERGLAIVPDHQARGRAEGDEDQCAEEHGGRSGSEHGM